ncbi:AraC family transcriptional regulator [Bradyrhizobium liaoningense]|uniref:AraC family transcriptional regulator n=1 Tax=Bradyrhizobium liaoningense TaxID=43992 RepID=UPI001FEA8854|nr:helix-turn-helix transcriptional regulator [Bradyrhizobium liaoningense]
MLDELTTRHLAFHATHRALTAMEVDYPDGVSTGVHAHPTAQLLYAIEGVMVVRSIAGTWIVPPNRAVWLAPGLDHETVMSGRVRIRTVFVDPDASPYLPEKNCVIAVSPLLRELIVAATRIPVDYDAAGRDGRLMRLLLDELRVSDVLPLYLPFPDDARLRTICAAIADDPSDSSTVEQWAERVGITAKTVHRLFAKQTGMSFAQWRRQARLLHALRRIASGEKIIDVAFDCGYASQSAFAAMFRRHFGVPPSMFYR